MHRFLLVSTVVALVFVQRASAADIDACRSKATDDERNACYDTICDFSVACARDLVEAATASTGPSAGIEVLHDLVARGEIRITKDGHDLAHQVGRTAARVSNGGWETFLACPDDYFLGCKHGFFEGMLGELGSSVEAAAAVCDKAPRSEKGFCFHGMGHGIMMSSTNDVFRSLLLCDRLSGNTAKRGCYQGVFMENVNAVSRGEAKAGVFDTADVLVPCTKVAEHYRRECYGQHADYILRSLSGSILSVIAACERAGNKEWTDACVRHVGQNMTTFVYQTHFLGSFDEATAPEGAITLCNQFPEKHQSSCRRGAVVNFMLYDHPEQAIRFCSLLGEEWCHSIVLTYLKRPIYSSEEKEHLCPLFPGSSLQRECHHPVLWPLISDMARIAAAAVVISAAILLWMLKKRV